MSGEGPLPGSAVFSLCPHMAEGEKDLSGVSFYKRALMSFMRAPPSWPNHLPKAPISKTTTLENRFQQKNFGRTQTSSPQHPPYCEWTTSNQLRAFTGNTEDLWERMNSAPRLSVFRLQMATSTFPWFFSLLACPTDFRLTGSHNHVSQFLKINLFLVYIYTSYWFCFSGELRWTQFLVSLKNSNQRLYKWTYILKLRLAYKRERNPIL